MSRDTGKIALDRLLDELSAENCEPTPGVIEQKLRTRCRTLRARRQKQQRTLVAFAVAACLLFILGWRLTPPRLRQVEVPQANLTGFLALPYAQSGIPMEQAIVVRVNLQQADLAALGLPSAWKRGRTQARADLLMGQDGVARAVRFTDEPGR